MSQVEFLKAVQSVHDNTQFAAIPCREIKLSVNDQGRFVLRWPDGALGVVDSIRHLCELTSAPVDYITSLVLAGNSALACSNVAAGLLLQGGEVRLARHNPAEGAVVYRTNEQAGRINLAELFKSAAVSGARYGYELVQTDVRSSGAGALYALREPCIETSSGQLWPAVHLSYYRDVESSALPHVVHGVIQAECQAFISTELVGVRKFKYLKLANATHAALVKAVAAGTVDIDVTGAFVDNAFAIDVASALGPEIKKAESRTYTGDPSALLTAMVQGQLSPRAGREDEPKTQLQLALRASPAAFGIHDQPYAIVSKTEEQWGKLVLKHAPLAQASAG